jgi:tetratricopeptide (TPR) repeat protein
MNRFVIIFGVGLLFILTQVLVAPQFNPVAAEKEPTTKTPKEAPAYTGTQSCRNCHEKFYRIWAPSQHGLAMQPYTKDLAKKSLTPQTEDVVITDYRYKADISGDKGWVMETGPDGDIKYPMVHALGGKNVYYFLTPMDRGRLQTLPVAYDVRKKKWFDMAKSGVRHFPEESEEALSWKDWQYTFNTACYSCHVSQLSTDYDLKTDTYNTVWREPGINCETCHGPGEEHIKVCEAAPKGTIPKDLKMIRGGRDFTTKQNNDTCSSCHAKAMPLTKSYGPGDPFFDHFDLVTLENPDFYPDGRDLGENYTFTTWRMSPCVKAGNLNCLHCHTSSGRYRFKGKKTNQACMPCHKERVENAGKHTRHKPNSTGNTCVGCHMPTTEFARMRRSDHSMLPPTPAATIAFKSPNACNICHKDKTPEWSDKWVGKWRKRDYQASVLHRAGLVDAARKRDWSRLSDMLAYVENKDRDEIFTTSLLRLLRSCDDPVKWPAIIKSMYDPSPLVRGAAAVSLESLPTRQALQLLLKATGDDSRLVRVRAASGLTRFSPLLAQRKPDDQNREQIESAINELIAFYMSRPDQWSSHYNFGNYYFSLGRPDLALEAFKKALKFEPRALAALVNASMAYSRMGKTKQAEETLLKALEIAPKSAAANFNMGLLKAEQKDLKKAEGHLRTALKADETMHQAAYNLGVLLAKEKPKESVKLLSKAFDTRPTPKYGYTLAFFMQQNGDLDSSIKMLEKVVAQWPLYTDTYFQLGSIYRRQGNKDKAAALFRKAIGVEGISARARLRLTLELQKLDGEKEPAPMK